MLLAGGGALAQPSECRATKKKRLKDAKAAAKASDIRVFQTHYGWRHDTGGFASLHPRLRATRSARAFDLSGRAAVIGGGHRGIEGIQPERLNAEGFSPSAFSRGLSVSATPGIHAIKRKASEGRESSRRGSRFSRSSNA